VKTLFSRRWWALDLVTLVGVAITTLFGPWWSFAVLVWLGAFERSRRGAEGFLATTLVATFTWFVIAFVRDATNGFRVSHRIGGFLGLPHGSVLYVFLGAIVFVVAALAAGSGSQLGRLGRSQSAR
jgi:hypothetical protein